MSFTNLNNPPSFDGNAVQVDTNVPAWLQYNIVESDATTNITFEEGSVEMWVLPDWNSGTGPGDWGRLIDVGAYSTNDLSSWWSLYFSPDGTSLRFSSDTDGDITDYINYPISWDTNTWHFIALTYRFYQTELYIDGQLVTNGPGVWYEPSEQAQTNGFYVGSDAVGTKQARGLIDDLATYNYALNATDVTNDYAAMLPLLGIGGGFHTFDDPTLPGGGGGGGGGSNSYIFSGGIPLDTNGLWLEITNISSDYSFFNLHNATNLVYALWTTTNLLVPFAVENELWPTDTNCQPFTLTNFTRQYLFVRAEDWTSVDTDGDGVPDWWAWYYWGTNNLPDTNLDYSASGLAFSQDYSNSVTPTVFAFTGLEVANNYVRTNLTGVQLDVAGLPYSMALSVDDTNYASDATWQNYAGSNVTVNLGSVQGWHQVWIGLRGHGDSLTNAVWQGVKMNLDWTPPTLVITGPTSGTVNVPVIQLTGYSPEALAGMSYAVSNGIGTVTNLSGFVLDQAHDTNLLVFTTNIFQAFDIKLTNGLNTITLCAADLAGNVTILVTNFTLDYSSKTNPPALSVSWPVNGITVGATNFTCHGLIGDPTAAITVQVADTSGNTNVVIASVGRDGTFWANGLPLSDGTNYLTITATDVVGNTTTTNLMVTEGTINLTVDSVASGQAIVTGEIDPEIAGDYTIWVNGSCATNNGDGTWAAQIAPVAGSGGAVEALAIPDSDNGGSGSGGTDPAGNPTSTDAQAVQAPVASPEGFYISMYQNFEQYIFTNAYINETMYDRHKWTDGKGGTGSHYSYYDWDADFPELDSFTWPVTHWPEALPNSTGTTIDWDFSPTNVYWHPWSTTNTYAGGPPTLAKERCDITHVDSWASALRQADSQLKLATGGTPGPAKMSLWAISVSATAIRPPYDADDNLWSGWSGTSSSIDPLRISVLGKQADSYGNLYTVLPDNTNLDATPVIKGAPSYYTYDVTGQKLHMELSSVTFNGTGYHDVISEYVSPDFQSGFAYPTPHWLTSDDLGNKRSSPAFYVCSNFVHTTTGFSVEGGSTIPVVVKGEASGGLTVFTLWGTNTPSGTNWTIDMVADKVLTNLVDCYNPMTINWSYAFLDTNAPMQFVNAGTSTNQVFVSLREPVVSILHHTLLKIACINAAGMSVDSNIVAAIWENFPGLHITRVNGDVITYWHSLETIGEEDSYNLALRADGICGMWADMFIDAQKVHNITGATDWGILPPLGFDYINVYTNLPAQGNPTPPTQFGDHDVVEWNGIFYDPSYGTAFPSKVAWEDASVSFYSNTNGVSTNDVKGVQNCIWSPL